MFFYFCALLIVIIDRLLKFLIQRSMYLGQSIPILNKVVKLTYVRNTGAAFSLFVGFSPYLVIIGLAVVIIVIYFHYRTPAKDLILQSGLACLLGGSIGNLIDRLAKGYVIDYIDITIWPVFNFADIMINLGVLFIALKFLRKEKIDVSHPI